MFLPISLSNGYANPAQLKCAALRMPDFWHIYTIATAQDSAPRRGSDILSVTFT
jgi:hypothetical protein